MPTPTPTPNPKERLEYLRGEIEAERISYDELAELQDLAEFIDQDDTTLREWAGVPEIHETENDNDTPSVNVNVKPDLYFVECLTGQKWIPLDCLPKEEAERHANFMRLGAVKPEDVRLVPLETVMQEKSKPE